MHDHILQKRLCNRVFEYYGFRWLHSLNDVDNPDGDILKLIKVPNA